MMSSTCCSLFCFYIKPQHRRLSLVRYVVVPYSVSTSNHNCEYINSKEVEVVPYSVSTSNHNFLGYTKPLLLVVPYSVSTSNHNRLCTPSNRIWLFLILFLHQTTTRKMDYLRWLVLFLILFLHQTTTSLWQAFSWWCCSLFCFYIKPQLCLRLLSLWFVVPYSVSTSNHNYRGKVKSKAQVVPYSVSTSNHNGKSDYSFPTLVVPYSVSTSNHNFESAFAWFRFVVPYSVSTSNHNTSFITRWEATVVPYSVSTSNHNSSRKSNDGRWVVPYSVSTSNHNAGYLIRLFPISYIVLTINKMDSELPAKCVWCYFLNLTNANILKKFQLLRRCELCSLNFSPKVLYFAILLIRDAQNTC